MVSWTLIIRLWETQPDFKEVIEHGWNIKGAGAEIPA